MSVKIYIAGPLFTLAERRFNEELASAVQARFANIAIVLPQREAAKIMGTSSFLREAFVCCLKAVDECDVVVAVLDGSDADSGTCVELGYAYARDKPIVGIRTDFRLSEDRGLNLMVANVCSALIVQSSLTSNIDAVAQKVVECIEALRDRCGTTQ